MTAACTFLEWDSAFFGSRIARVSEPALTEADATEVEAWCQQQQIDCLYWLIDAGDLASIRVAEQHRFQLVDIRMTLRLSVPSHIDDSIASLHLASAQDLAALQAIARVAHTDSRFFADERFPRQRCEELYAVWLERDMREGALWVADADGQPEGYITCRIREDGIGQIGLLGVGAAARGRGIGANLVKQSVRWFREQGIDTVVVVTQGRNARAQRTYQHAGFVTDHVQIWFHRWFT